MALTKVSQPMSSTPSIDDNGDTTVITIDSSERVMLGHTTAQQGNTLEITAKSDGGALGLFGRQAGGDDFSFIGAYPYGGGTRVGAIGFSPASGIQYYIGTSEKMRLDASGNLLVGTTSFNAGVVGFGAAPNGDVYMTRSESTNSYVTNQVYSTGAAAYRFYVGMAGTVYATSTSISAISDQTLKTNIRDLETGLTEVMALKPRRFDWKNGDAKNVAGFVAQEIEQVLPELVSDYKYSDTETKKSLKMGDILPTLVKAIQEQQATIESQAAAITDLTTRLTALENN